MITRNIQLLNSLKMMDERTTVVDNIEVESEVEEVKHTELLAKKDKWQAIFNKISFLFFKSFSQNAFDKSDHTDSVHLRDLKSYISDIMTSFEVRKMVCENTGKHFIFLIFAL